ncbi:hypothetical protein NC652_017369 [Populus alba x Populus x berolinensis]|uniref:Uncharacterized protein n=1 Tax=Populus alba x Populus x berolinensis TaxID=444605 RepID=A0AAD6QQ56_9ROSI|nr:hypothetical protein NC652_017369 [Populus alba x Populus x berolinensis]KAJ6994393.1 hypothetical protein NC653_017273 [Populus alba x Populus x berolinensis]
MISMTTKKAPQSPQKKTWYYSHTSNTKSNSSGLYTMTRFVHHFGRP